MYKLGSSIDGFVFLTVAGWYLSLQFLKDNGRIAVVGAVYDVMTGVIEFLPVAKVSRVEVGGVV